MFAFIPCPMVGLLRLKMGCVTTVHVKRMDLFATFVHLILSLVRESLGQLETECQLDEKLRMVGK
jgi:hypothetical protein